MRAIANISSLWVSPTGSDSNPGTEDRPFRTIQKAINASTPGTAVFVKEGVYKENLLVGSSSSHRLSNTTEDLPFTLVSADGPGKAVIEGVSTSRSTVNIFTGHVRVFDFEIRGVQWTEGDEAPIKIASSTTVAGARSDVVIDGNTITGTGRDGIKVAMTEGVVITNNTFEMTAHEDFIDFVTVWDSTIAFNTFKGTAARAINVKTGSQNIDITNNLIELESSFRTPGVAIVDIGGDGVTQLNRPPLPPDFVGFEAKNVRFVNNVVTGDSYVTVKFRGAVDSVVQGNLLYGRGPVGVSSERSVSPERDSSRNNKILDNVLRPDMRLHETERGQDQGLVTTGNRIGDKSDTNFLVGADRISSRATTETDDPFPGVGVYEIVIRAGGTGGTNAPRFQLVIDGEVVGEATVSNPVAGPFNAANDALFRDYAFSYVGAAPKQMDVRFLNAGYDRGANVNVNLYVDNFSVNGEVFEAEHFSEISRDGVAGTVAQRESLFNTGSMALDYMYLSPRWRAPKDVDGPDDPGDAPLQRIDVRVGGNGGVLKPVYEVWADGVFVGQGRVDGAGATSLLTLSKTAYETDSFAFRGPAPKSVAIVYVNDGLDSRTGVDLNMAVDHIDVNGRRFEAEDGAVYEFVNRNGEQIVTGREIMYQSGVMTFDVAPALSRETITVRAAGTGIGEEAPRFQVRANGVAIATETILNPLAATRPFDRSAYRDYDFEVVGSKTDTLEIVFLNDGALGDAHRDLYIDYVEIDGRRLQAETDGAYSFVRNGASVTVTGWESMYRDGVMTFDFA